MGELSSLIETNCRGLDEILELHQLTEQDFEGKVVADLGCGDSPIAKELEDRGVNTTVFSVDGRSETLRRVIEKGLVSIPVQGRLEALPFLDESIDMLVGSYSLPMWGSAEQIRQFYRECKRVVRVGGLLSITPIAIHPMSEDDLVGRHLAAQFGAVKIRGSEDWRVYKRDPGILPDLLSVIKIRKIAEL